MSATKFETAAPAAAKAGQPRRWGWPIAGVGLLVAGGLAGYGIWTRQSATTDLTKTTDDSSLPRVQMITPKGGPKQRSLTLPGNVEAWYQAAIYGQVTGYVSAWYKDYGAEVKTGDVLATIETPGLDAELAASKAQLATAKARYNLAVVTSKRYSALAGTQAVAQQDVDIRKADETEQKSEVAAAEQNVIRYEAQSAFKRLVAPFDGVVTTRGVNLGDYVSAAGSDPNSRGVPQALFTVSDVHKLRIFVSVPQNFSDALRPGLQATMTLPQEPGKRIPLQFLTTAKAVVTATRSVVTEFMLDNPNHEQWPGSYASVQFVFPSDPNVLVVPEQAVLFRAQGTQVALIGDGDKVRLQDVVLGRNLGTDVQVTSGLKRDDKLVANPSLGLLDGQQVKVVQPAAGADPSAAPAAPANQSQPGQQPGSPQAGQQPHNGGAQAAEASSNAGSQPDD